MTAALDASRMNTKEAAHEYLRQQLDLPQYYGNNLDALYDCLTEADDLEVSFYNYPEDETGYFQRVLRIFKDASYENPGLRIVGEE